MSENQQEIGDAVSQPWYLKKRVWIIGAVVILYGIGLISGDDDTTSSGTNSGSSSQATPANIPSGFWSKYPPALKAIIDEDAAAGNCSLLQSTFDTWANAHDPGSGNDHVDLMEYIDSKLAAAGCY